MADIIQTVARGKRTRTDVVSALSVGGLIRPSDLEPLTTAAVEFGFLREEGEILAVSEQGAAFERYVSALGEEEQSEESRTDDGVSEASARPILMELCATFPPPWADAMVSALGGRIRKTSEGYRKVVSDAASKLCVVTPFVDVSVLQMCLESKHSKELEFSMITSDEKLAQQFASGQNWRLQKLGKIVGGRFKSGCVYYLRDAQTIAHAKLWCSERAVFVTSANVTSDSITDNFELGIYTDDDEAVATTWEILAQAFKMSDLTCIFKSP